MKRIYVLPEYLDNLFNNESKINLFILDLFTIQKNISNLKDDYKCQIILDFEKFEEYQELELYDFRMLASLYIDDFSFIQPPYIPNDFKKYVVCKIPNIFNTSFDETNQKTHIALAHDKNIDAKVVNSTSANFNLLLLDRFDNKNNPKLITNHHIDITSLELDLFFEKYILKLFTNTSEFQKFKAVYIKFRNSFDWKLWNPKTEPAPAHHLLQKLKEYFTKSKKNKEEYFFWGHIMAFLNGAYFNKHITLLNSQNKTVNDVFQLGVGKGKNTVFFSIDTENGNLELYNSQGIHMNHVYGIITGLRKQKRDYIIDAPFNKWIQ